MRVTWLELFAVVYTAFGLGQFVTTYVNFGIGRFFFSNWARLGVLLIWIGLIFVRRFALKRALWLGIAALAAILSIELYHVARLGVGTGEVTGIRAVLYNPLYSSLINLFMLVLILHQYDFERRRALIRCIVVSTVWLLALHGVMWFLVFFRLVPVLEPASPAQVLNNNTMSYSACFVFYLLHFTPLRLEFSKRRSVVFTIVAVAFIVMNTTRGAMVIVAAYVAILVFSRMSSQWKAAVALTACCAVIVGGILLLRSEKASIYGSAFARANAIVEPLSDEHVSRVTEISMEEITGGEADEAVVSALGRVYANVAAFSLFRAHFVLGIGTFSAYSIKAFGMMGIHSLLFLYLLSSGVIGLLLLVVLFGVMQVRRSSALRSHVLYLLPMAVFLNIFPLWYAVSFFLTRDGEGDIALFGNGLFQPRERHAR